MKRDPIALDIHAHLIPVRPHELGGIEGVSWDGERMDIDGHKVGIKSIYKPEALLDWMAREEVAHAWVSAPPPTYRPHLRGEGARRWCAYLNDALAEICAAHLDRLTALPHLPTQDPELATEIVENFAVNGVTCFSMPTGTGDERGITEPEFEPLWRALDEAGATIFFHPGECADGRLKAYYLNNLLGNPYESAVAIGHLLLGGILEQYSCITPCFAHGGGAFPMVAERLQRGFDTTRPGIDAEGAAPNALLSRIHVDCICHGPAPLALAEQTFGADNVLFGSDWPFPMGLVEPHAQLADLAPEHRQRIFQTNANRLKGIDQ